MMDWCPVRLCALLDLLVVLFQVFGIMALFLSRLHRVPRWAERSKVAVVVALVGLGVAGALCGRQDSEFGLFAGLTMTSLLIGMTVGGGPDTNDPPSLVVAPDGPSSV